MYKYILLFVFYFCIALNSYAQTSAEEIIEENSDLIAHEALTGESGNTASVLNQFMKDDLLNEDENQLIQSVFINDTQKAKTLLDKGVNPNISYSVKQKDNSTYKTTLLHLIIAGNEKELFDLVLNQKDIAINNTGFIAVQDTDSIKHVEMTPLTYAVYINNIYMAEQLLTKGADSNKYGHKSYPAIFYAKDEKMIKLLSKYNTDFNILVDNATRPLFEAVKNNQSQKASMLLESGADINKKDGAGNTLLFTAISKGYYELARFLIDKNAKVDESSGSEKVTPLMITLSRPDHDAGFIRYLIFKGASVSAKDINGRTPLFYIHNSSENNIEHIKESLAVLMENNADINAKDNKGNTVLHIRPQDYYKIYSSYKPNINIQNKNGNTPLHIAAELDNVTSLLTGSPDKTIKNNKGETPLKIAEKHGYKKSIAYLSLSNGESLLLLGGVFGDTSLINKALENKIDLNKEIMGHYPVYYAAKGGNADVFAKLVSSGAKLNNVPNLVYDVVGSFTDEKDQNNRVELSKIFIDREVSLNWAKYSDFLHILVKEQCENNLGQGYIRTVLAHAVSKGADPNLKNKDGKAPLHIAALGKYKSYDLVLELISSGANVDLLDNDNNPAIYYCAKAPYNKNKVFLALLDNSKLDINAVYGSEGNTLLMEAAKSGNKLIVMMLIARGADDTLTNKNGKTALMLAKEEFESKYSNATVDEKNGADYKNYKFLTERFLFDKNTVAECRSGINEECKKYYKPVEVLESPIN